MLRRYPQANPEPPSGSGSKLGTQRIDMLFGLTDLKEDVDSGGWRAEKCSG
jgi:hypothetical protein